MGAVAKSNDPSGKQIVAQVSLYSEWSSPNATLIPQLRRFREQAYLAVLYGFCFFFLPDLHDPSCWISLQSFQVYTPLQIDSTPTSRPASACLVLHCRIYFSCQQAMCSFCQTCAFQTFMLIQIVDSTGDSKMCPTPLCHPVYLCLLYANTWGLSSNMHNCPLRSLRWCSVDRACKLYFDHFLASYHTVVAKILVISGISSKQIFRTEYEQYLGGFCMQLAYLALSLVGSAALMKWVTSSVSIPLKTLSCSKFSLAVLGSQPTRATVSSSISFPTMPWDSTGLPCRGDL